jgi:hypothetical protein
MMSIPQDTFTTNTTIVDLERALYNGDIDRMMGLLKINTRQG